MTAQDFIIAKLEKLKRPEPLQVVAPEKLESEILARILSKKFRKVKADEAAIKICKKAIHYSVQNNKPIKINSLFGGNKLWRLDEAPEPDWAELFNLIYSARWMKLIASVYKYGAEFEYCSQDVSIERLNNVSRRETDQYQIKFRELLSWFQQYLPERVTITYKRHAEIFDDLSEYDKEIEEVKAKMLAKNGGQLPKMSDAQKLATELNVKLRPGQSDDPSWREKVELEHQAIFETKTLLSYLTDETMIPSCPGFYAATIVTGSTKYSIAKFWAGVGALRPAGDSFEDIVLTPKQLASTKFEWQNVNLGISGKNFAKIRIIKES